jgi:signal transduction histidine kinase
MTVADRAPAQQGPEDPKDPRPSLAAWVPGQATNAALPEAIGAKPTLPPPKTETAFGYGRVAWMGWRLRLLVMATLAACIAMVSFVDITSSVVVLKETLIVDDGGVVKIAASKRDRPQVVAALADDDGMPLTVEPLVLEPSARWITTDVARMRHAQLHDDWARAVQRGEVRWTLGDGRMRSSVAEPLGWHRLGPTFWLLSLLALALFIVVMVVALARPSLPNALYALLALPQSGNLLFIAFESAVGVYTPEGFAFWDHAARSSFDLVTAGAIAHAMAVHPRPLPWRHTLPLIVWVGIVALIVALFMQVLPGAWWTVQATCIGLSVLSLAQLLWSNRREPHPLAAALIRFGAITLAVFTLLTVAVSVSSQGLGGTRSVASIGAVILVIFMATLFLATPFMSRPQATLREFSMLAGVSTIATALDLLFVAVFSLGPFASLTLATFFSLMVYAGVRQWILNHMVQTNIVTTERMFEQLYRIARDVEKQPQHLPQQLAGLLRELYDPMEITTVNRSFEQAFVAGGGATLMVPVPSPPTADNSAPRGSTQALALRYAHRGKRLFTPEDAKLTDRVLEQLARAVLFDQAVERGRAEERERIAQDLHDDIGARLLTMMYKSPNADMEEYIRQTIQELKTLTRGLTAKNHRLSHAVGEWKADAANRLQMARCELDWTFEHDVDPLLNVVQWSAITRILRELLTNTIAHGHATRVQVQGKLERGRLQLILSDNGVGQTPSQWGHGLGMGGIRKRVKQHDGTVQWSENTPRGIRCTVNIALTGPL